MVLIWGLTAILGKGIHLPTTVLVAWRTGLAGIAMFAWLKFRDVPLWPGKIAALKMMVIGAMIGLHWFLFFLAGKLGPVSIALVGVATCSLWCALLEPFFVKGKKWRGLELVCGALVVVGAAIIGHGDPVSWQCLLTGVAAAIVAAFFSFCNDRMVKAHDPRVMTFYEMVGAFAVMSIASAATGVPRILPEGNEWIWILLLSQICTVWAFSVYIGLLRQISVFIISLVSNLEPVYGILLAGFIFDEYEKLNGWFWLGAAVVLGSVLAYPLLQKRKARRLALLPL